MIVWHFRPPTSNIHSSNLQECYSLNPFYQPGCLLNLVTVCTLQHWAICNENNSDYSWIGMLEDLQRPSSRLWEFLLWLYGHSGEIVCPGSPAFDLKAHNNSQFIHFQVLEREQPTRRPNWKRLASLTFSYQVPSQRPSKYSTWDRKSALDAMTYNAYHHFAITWADEEHGQCSGT